MRRLQQLIFAIILATLLSSSLPAIATISTTGTNIEVLKGTKVNDDLAAIGQRVNVSGTIVDNGFLVGGRINFSGSSGRSLFLAGQTITVNGTVGDDLLAAGADVEVSGKVARNANITGGQVSWTSSASAGRDLSIAGGSVLVDGRVGRNLMATGGQITINGRIGKNVEARGGTLTLGKGAVVVGNLTFYGDRRPSIQPGAKVLGQTIYRHEVQHRRGRPAFGFAAWLLTLIGAFIVGSILIAISPNTSRWTTQKMVTMPLHSILAGFIVLIIVPVIVLLLMATIIGIPLALIIGAAYLIALYVGPIFVGLSIGELMFRRRERTLYLDLLVGLVILWGLIAVPVIGGLIKFLSILIGLGGLVYQRYDSMRQLRSEGRI